jgi:hypothetical protein
MTCHQQPSPSELPMGMQLVLSGDSIQRSLRACSFLRSPRLEAAAGHEQKLPNGNPVCPRRRLRRSVATASEPRTGKHNPVKPATFLETIPHLITGGKGKYLASMGRARFECQPDRFGTQAACGRHVGAKMEMIETLPSQPSQWRIDLQCTTIAIPLDVK